MRKYTESVSLALTPSECSINSSYFHVTQFTEEDMRV